MISTRAPDIQISVYRKISSELKKLKWLAGQRKTTLKYQFCWISKTGKLCMRKAAGNQAITISSEEDLLALE